ncbi:thiamine-monophosphate kinase [Bacillus tianshenii]|uniref:Thiamine-monophosphate kinase n=1 Tax=Sutcliffiella tianshenii TaxID=1463404 RepID=A0ABS2P5C2_9BACI|nr:thiamine-phosphate kinase [Bacillus tianshenii]MBM7622162.1 thiamine-monophosphate kinase [Bacillus tianshenii]
MSVSDEFGFISSIQPQALFHGDKVVGIGDDAAIVGMDEGFESVVCVDTMVEGVHFNPDTMKPYDIGYKALAANISDIAAMGGIPLYYLVSISIPKAWPEEELLDIYKGMKALGDQYRMDLIGGDTTSGKSLVLSVFVIGKVEKGKRLLRSNATPGDLVFVSGTLGDSAAGLDVLLQGHSGWDELKRKHQNPAPQVELGRILTAFDRVALNDVSDGIASELMEIAEASHVDIVINKDTLPLSTSMVQYKEEKALKWALAGGEDFELVGTISAKDWSLLQKRCQDADIQITQIGEVTAIGKGQVFLKDEGQSVLMKKEGYNHFLKE